MNKPKIIKKKIKQHLWEIQNGNKPKVFGIGNGKTGTTSLHQAMIDLGYKAGNQRAAENLYNEWALRNFKPIIEYCKSGDFFQDFPFCKPFTYVALDNAFPNSKFILTVRDSSEQWYNSLVKFHSKKWGKNGNIPTKKDLKNSEYIFKGRAWILNRLCYNTPEDNPYQKEIMVESYESHIVQVKEYFRHRPNDLLVLNIGKRNAYKKLCEFLGKPIVANDFPWLNKTETLKNRK